MMLDKNKFRAYDKRSRSWLHGYAPGKEGCYINGETILLGEWLYGVRLLDLNNIVIMQFSGLRDKHEVDIYEGDVVEYYVVYRQTQTHTGDNIPNGSYTEPMEPGLKKMTVTVFFRNGMFCVNDERADYYHYSMPLNDVIGAPTIEDVAFSMATARSTFNPDDIFGINNDDDDNDFKYLMELAGVSTIDELLELLRGVKVVGNIFDEEFVCECDRDGSCCNLLCKYE